MDLGNRDVHEAMEHRLGPLGAKEYKRHVREGILLESPNSCMMK